jgi:hypothetical protein
MDCDERLLRIERLTSLADRAASGMSMDAARWEDTRNDDRVGRRRSGRSIAPRGCTVGNERSLDVMRYRQATSRNGYFDAQFTAVASQHFRYADDR